MKKVIKVLILTIIILSLYNATAFAEYKTVIISTDEIGRKTFVEEGFPNENVITNVKYGCDISEVDWQGCCMYFNNQLVHGTTTYTGFDSSKLGLQTVDFTFNPDDQTLPSFSGQEKVFVRMNVKNTVSDDEDVVTSFAEPSVTLEPNTSYTPHLLDMIEGSEYTWTSSDKLIAKVNKKTGKITAVSTGTATINCKVDTPYDDTYTLSITATVKSPSTGLRAAAAVSGSALSVSDNTITMTKGGKLTLTPNYDHTSSTCLFKSSKSSIVQIDGYTGQITAKKPGGAYILCTITSKDYSVRTIRYDIIVE
jgi:hypothetical protein